MGTPTLEEFEKAQKEDAKLEPKVEKLKLFVSQHEAGLLTNEELLLAAWTIVYNVV